MIIMSSLFEYLSCIPLSKDPDDDCVALNLVEDKSIEEFDITVEKD